MTNVEKALLFGAGMTVLYLVYTNPRCNQFCKALVGNVINTNLKRLR